MPHICKIWRSRGEIFRVYVLLNARLEDVLNETNRKVSFVQSCTQSKYRKEVVHLNIYFSQARSAYKFCVVKSVQF
jgi:hypothetical protein